MSPPLPRPPNYLESLISPIVESIETFLRERRREGEGHASRQSGPLGRPLSGRARLGIRSGSAGDSGGRDVDADDESGEGGIDKGRRKSCEAALIGAEIMAIDPKP